MTSITEELRARQIEPSKFTTVYNIIHAVSDVKLPDLSIPDVYGYELNSIFNYLTKVGVLKEGKGAVYKVNKDRLEVMEKRIKAGELRVEVASSVHGE